MKNWLEEAAQGNMLRLSVRRRWVMVTALGYAAALAVAVLADATDTAIGWVSLLLMGISLLGTMGTAISTSRLGSSLDHTESVRDDALDERQKVVEDRAYRLSYRVLQSFAMVLVVYLLAALSGAVPLGSLAADFGRTAAILLFGGMYLVFYLPMAIIAWTEPDPPTEEDS